MITLARFLDGVEVLDERGWRRPDANEWTDIGGGNYLQFNAEGYWTGWWHGLSLGVLVALCTLGFLAMVM